MCAECRRKVYEVQITAPRMRLLLDAFDKLANFCYDKELNFYSHYAGSQTHAELEARGFAWSADDDVPRREREPDLVIPDGWLKICKLSETALSALNQLRQDYEFEEGPAFLDSVLHVLRHLAKRTAAQGRLRRQLETIPFNTRESLSRSLAAGSNSGLVQSDVAKPQTT